MYTEQSIPEVDPQRAKRAGSGPSNSTLHAALLPALLTDLDQLYGVAANINGTLVETRQRLFGPWPFSGQNAPSLKEACASCMEAQLTEALTRLQNALQEARENASFLNGRL